jgi:hypothetical protein
MGFPWAQLARGRPGENFGGTGGSRPPGVLPTFEIPTNVLTAKPSAGQTVVAEAAARDVENKRHLVTWQIESCVHARAHNQRDATESMEGQRWANGRTQTSSGPFGATAIPPTTTATGVPWDSKWKLEPMKKADAERPQPKPNLPLMGGTGKPKSLMQPQPLAEVHPFTPTLHEWQQGIEVNCGPNWS